jgi:carboxyl-terminal processing protease
MAGAFILQSRDTRDSVRLFSQVFDLVSTTFVDTVSPGDLYERAARGLLEQLDDPYAALYSPKQLQDFTATTGGRYGGIGMLVEEQEGARSAFACPPCFSRNSRNPPIAAGYNFRL